MKIQKFPSFSYKLPNGENVVATMRHGVVTLVGDKNGVRQMDLRSFLNKITTIMERSPETDTINISSIKNKM